MHLAPFARRVVVGLLVVASCLAVLPAAFAWELFSSPHAQSRPAANSAVPDNRSPNAEAPTRHGPLFHGQELHWPTMPFMRSKPKAKTPTNRPDANPNRAAVNASGQTASRFAGPAAPQTPYSPQRMSRNPSAAANRSYHNQAGAPVRSQRMAMSASPRSTAADSRTAQREPTLARTEPDQTPAAAPASAADRLLAQANEWSGSAKTEGDYTRIIEACQQARASKPSPAMHRYAAELASWAFNRRGQLKAEAGQYEDALTDFNDALRADSERWLAYHNRGILLAQSGDFERAFDDFSHTIQLNPKFAKAYANRAALLMVAGDLDTALQDYQRAIELDPELVVAQRGCGRVCHLQRRLDEALQHYNEAVRLEPNDAYSAASRADLLTDLGRYAEAAAEYERSIQLDPHSDHAYSSSAWLLATCPDASVRNPALAIERAQHAVELTGGQDAVSFDTLAAAQASAGDFSAATETVRQAVRLASSETRKVYEQRLHMYQRAKPYRIAPVGEVVQASYETGSGKQGAGSRE